VAGGGQPETARGLQDTSRRDDIRLRKERDKKRRWEAETADRASPTLLAE
jgi:hypothetical protein